ncbi:MAG: group II intron reverse transcriptase/maturase [Rhizobiaceae bacterium]
MTDKNRNITERKYIELPEAFGVNGTGLQEAVFRLRKRLYIKAKQEPKFRFYTLYDRISRQDVIRAAWDRVADNDGSPGVDGISIRDVETSPQGVDGFLEEIYETLKAKRYRPQAVKRVMIPKAGGGERPLGIPTIRDRVVQTAVKLILEPIFEADFLSVSYGYRPGRSAHDALTAVKEGLEGNRTAVLDADLKGYFDSIPHDKLMACVEMRVSDRSVLKLIRQFLRAPILEEPKDRHEPPRKVYPKKGTPQGGVISALLANLYLHWLDKRFHAKDGPAKFAGARIVRYADDFVILARYQGSRISDWVESVVEDWMGLEINRQKTRIVRLGKGGDALDFLGFRFRYEPSRFRGPKRFLAMSPSPSACARERDKIRNMLSRQRCYVPVPLLIQELNQQLTGWAGYFDKGRSRPALRRMNWFVIKRLVRHLNRRSQRPYRPPEGKTWYAHFYHDLGLVKL